MQQEGEEGEVEAAHWAEEDLVEEAEEAAFHRQEEEEEELKSPHLQPPLYQEDQAGLLCWEGTERWIRGSDRMISPPPQAGPAGKLGCQAQGLLQDRV